MRGASTVWILGAVGLVMMISSAAVVVIRCRSSQDDGTLDFDEAGLALQRERTLTRFFLFVGLAGFWIDVYAAIRLSYS